MFGVPHAIVTNPDGSKYTIDLPSQMFKDRVIFMTGEVDDTMADIMMAELLSLDASNTSHEPIHVYINSPGGSVTAGMAIYDTMKTIKSPVYTYCIGLAASMGAFLLSSGDKRFCAPEAEVMIHQPLGGAKGQAADIEITAKHILKTREKLNRIMAQNTGKPLEEVEKATDRDNWLTAQEALDFGLIDEILPYKEKNVKKNTQNTSAAATTTEEAEKVLPDVVIE